MVYVCEYTHIYTYTEMYVCIRVVNVYVCVCIHMYIHVYTSCLYRIHIYQQRVFVCYMCMCVRVCAYKLGLNVKLHNIYSMLRHCKSSKAFQIILKVALTLTQCLYIGVCGGSMSQIGASNSSFKTITNTARVRARLYKLQKKVHWTRSRK